MVVSCECWWTVAAVQASSTSLNWTTRYTTTTGTSEHPVGSVYEHLVVVLLDTL